MALDLLYQHPGRHWRRLRHLADLCQRETPTQRKPIDTVGLALLVLWVGSLQVMLDKGKELDWFNSSTIVVLALVALVSFCFFVIWEITEEHPVVDLTLFKRINFTGGVVAISVGYGLFFGNLVILPQWLQIHLGYTATEAGLVLAPVGLFAILLSPVIGKTLPKLDARWVVTVSFLLFALVFLMRSHFNTLVDTRTLMIPTFLQGVPMSMFFIPLTAIILSGLPPSRIPAAAGCPTSCGSRAVRWARRLRRPCGRTGSRCTMRS